MGYIMFNYKRLTTALLTGTIVMFSVTGCANTDVTQAEIQVHTNNSQKTAFTSNSDLKVEYTSEELDASFDESTCTKIVLGNETVEITSPGTYLLSGTLTEKSIHVNCNEKDTVRFILNGVQITNSTEAPIVIEEAKKVILTLAEGTNNTITDSRNTTTEQEYSAAISSKADLTINGKGTLTVNAKYRNGIKSSDDLKIVSGTFDIDSKEDGIVGKDLLAVRDGNYTITAGTDGMKSTYDTDTSKGNIVIEGGQFQITSQNDGIQSQNILAVSNGIFTIKTGTGASEALKSNSNINDRQRVDWGNNATTTSDNSESNKGLKSENATYITGGTYTIDSQDDSIHSNGQIVIDGGTFYLSTGDDGIHADSSIEMNGGSIDIQKSYEGIEAEKITINQGSISIVSSDDGINAANGSSTGFSMGGGMKNNGQNVTENAQSSTILLTINGGTIVVNADGDGIDSNGSVIVNGGEIVVMGPTNNNNAALDFDSQFEINGGTLMAFGSSGMLEVPTSAANGCCLAATFETQTDDLAFELKDSSGNTIMSYTPVKSYSSAIVYSEKIKSSNQYTIKAGNSSVELTATEGVTTSGNVGMGGMPGNQGMFGNQGKPDMQGGRGGRGSANNDGMSVPSDGIPGEMGMPNTDGVPDKMGMPNADGVSDEIGVPNRGSVPNEMNMPENEDGNNNAIPDKNNIKQKGQNGTDTQDNMNFM